MPWHFTNARPCPLVLLLSLILKKHISIYPMSINHAISQLTRRAPGDLCPSRRGIRWRHLPTLPRRRPVDLPPASVARGCRRRSATRRGCPAVSATPAGGARSRWSRRRSRPSRLGRRRLCRDVETRPWSASPLARRSISRAIHPPRCSRTDGGRTRRIAAPTARDSRARRFRFRFRFRPPSLAVSRDRRVRLDAVGYWLAISPSSCAVNHVVRPKRHAVVRALWFSRIYGPARYR